MLGRRWRVRRERSIGVKGTARDVWQDPRFTRLLGVRWVLRHASRSVGCSSSVCTAVCLWNPCLATTPLLRLPRQAMMDSIDADHDGSVSQLEWMELMATMRISAANGLELWQHITVGCATACQTVLADAIGRASRHVNSLRVNTWLYSWISRRCLVHSSFIPVSF